MLALLVVVDQDHEGGQRRLQRTDDGRIHVDVEKTGAVATYGRIQVTQRVVTRAEIRCIAAVVGVDTDRIGSFHGQTGLSGLLVGYTVTNEVTGSVHPDQVTIVVDLDGPFRGESENYL